MKAHPLLTKTLALLFVEFVLWLPLAMIGAKINERSVLQRQVEREIEATAFAVQRVAGPVVVLECAEDYLETVTFGPRAESVRQERKSRPCPTRYVFPDALSIQGDVPTETRRRGIHAVRIFQAELAISGTFRLPREPDPVPGATRRWTTAALAIIVDDLRGLKNSPALLLDGHSLPFEPGARMLDRAQTLQAPLDLKSIEADTAHPFSLALQLHGTSRLAFVPMAMGFDLTLQSTWPHPSFDGAFLPDTRSVARDGFRATWHVNQFAAGGAGAWSDSLRSAKLDGARTLGVSFIDPINVYTQTYRAAEYGIVVIGLTFALFLLLEATRRWRVHPVQYGLIGLALAIFFLLLLALAEHVGFATAYVAAAAACVALLTFYVTHVAGSRRRGVAFGAYFAALYGTLYIMLSLEDSALLVGTLLAFTALSGVMIATRRLDWFAWSASLKTTTALP